MTLADYGSESDTKQDRETEDEMSGEVEKEIDDEEETPDHSVSHNAHMCVIYAQILKRTHRLLIRGSPGTHTFSNG